MVDIPGNGSTTSTIGIGGAISNTLEFAGDHDWFRINLTAGQSISVILEGLSLADPIVYVRNAGGAVIFQNDDWGDGLDSFVAFQAPSTGTFYIDVGSAPNNQTGSYQLSVAPYTPPPIVSIDAIAGQLTHGFWNGDAHHFDVSASRSITVNLTGLDAQGLAVARESLAIWTDIIGVAFPEVAVGGQIVFDDLNEGTGAFSTSVWANGITSSATVNVSLSRLSFHTYLHEIAHALGLGHAGDYNGGTAFSRYPYEAMFLNDGAAVSIMSYFDNAESSYYAGLGFTNSVIGTPQLADIIAMGNLYGLSTTTRTGDTTYGFNNNSGREVFNAAVNPAVAYTVFDSGGSDTLDYSGFAQNQLINLNAESFSNVGSGVGNVSIARGVVIENAIGGGGNDTLIGNTVANLLSGRGGADILTGGTGHDIFQDTTANLNGDTITDLGVGDRIVFTDAAPASFTFSLSGSMLNFTGGSLLVHGGIIGSLAAAASPVGGVELVLLTNDVRNDFNGDGRSDILWRNTDGSFGDWLANANGSYLVNGASISGVSTHWQIAATGDFNGDGRDDILWRGQAGELGNWLAGANGTFSYNGAAGITSVATSWQVVGTGDFNGDGRDDILWRDSDGTFGNWLAHPGGVHAALDASITEIPNYWQIAGVGDFNNDGRDDILWRGQAGEVGNWLANSDGSFDYNAAAGISTVPNSWQIAGVGDFNFDGRDDILWRNSEGTIGNWLANSSGGHAANDASLHGVPNYWQVDAIGDFNGDGRDDILWRGDGGEVGNWLAGPAGIFSFNAAAGTTVVTNNWQVEPDNSLV